MDPGDLFVKDRTNKKNRWKPLYAPNGVVHLGKRMHRAVSSGKTVGTNVYQARCDSTVRLATVTLKPVTCLFCLGAV